MSASIGTPGMDPSGPLPFAAPKPPKAEPTTSGLTSAERDSLRANSNGPWVTTGMVEAVARIKADAIAIATADQRDRMVDMERQRNYWRDQAGRLTLRLRAVPAQPGNTKAADQ